MKGIILHGGHGTRLGPLTYSGPKQLLPITNKTMSQYTLEDLVQTGISDISIIIGDVYPEKVKKYYGDGSRFGIKITYILQDEPKGISHAIGLCKDFVGNEKFVVFLGDNILRKGLGDFAKRFISSEFDCMILLSEVDDPTRFGIAEFENQKIKKIIEKPKDSSSHLASIGVYFLTPKIFEIIEKLEPSRRGELEITDALQLALEKGFSIGYEQVTGWWKDTGTPEDILDANRLVLDTLRTSNQLTNIKLKNPEKIILGKNCIISSDSKIIGPVIIGDDCRINSSIIGPYVSIGTKSEIQNSTIDNSIIMTSCKISTRKRISSSIISHSSEIFSDEKQKHDQFLVGEKSKIKI